MARAVLSAGATKSCTRLMTGKERALRWNAIRLFELRAVQLVAELGDGFIDHPAGAIDCAQRAMLGQRVPRGKRKVLAGAYSVSPTCAVSGVWPSQISALAEKSALHFGS